MELDDRLACEVERLCRLVEAAAPDFVRPAGWRARLARFLAAVVF
ncbi:MAG TPA: hypothetical protein VNO22_05685 [Planctomycetota bacterium]|nr:hypothetical protein [Planctomycetota bacterium]